MNDDKSREMLADEALVIEDLEIEDLEDRQALGVFCASSSSCNCSSSSCVIYSDV